ncbi:MAG: hypothetical protein IPG24_02325 [Leptospiraceae bacterium]|nr:hypothetical protein [Leptospiraceae bacterium]
MIRIFILFSFLSLEIFSQATITKIVNEKGAIKNLTEEQFVSNVVDLIHNEKQIIASVNAGLQVEYKLTGETVSNFKEFGNMALVITNKNLLAISNNATEFARQPLFSDMNITYTVSNSLIFVITNRKIYSYTVSSSEWRSIDLTGEYVRSHAAFDKTGTLITNKRIISYSEFTKEFHFFNIDIFTPVNNYTVLADKIIFASSRKTIIYRATTGEYSVVNFN